MKATTRSADLFALFFVMASVYNVLILILLMVIISVRAGMHLTNARKAHYSSAIKELLKKTRKLKKSKRLVELIKGTKSSMVNSTASVNVIRGKQLTALTNQLVVTKPTSQNVHTSAKHLFGVDSTRHYDPLLVLPVESATEFVDNLLTVCDEADLSRSTRSKQNVLPYTTTLPVSYSVPKLISQFKQMSRQRVETNGENKIKIAELDKLMPGFTKQPHLLELRKKLRVGTLEQRMQASEVQEIDAESHHVSLDDTIFGEVNVSETLHPEANVAGAPKVKKK